MKNCLFKTNRCKWSLIALIGIILFATVHYYALRSYLVMIPYSLYHQSGSLLRQEKLDIRFPNGNTLKLRQWYPMMLVFHDEQGFGRWMNESLALTVLYRFGGFHFGKSSSGYFDREHEGFSSFYGAYLVKDKSNPERYFGFDGDEVVLTDIIRVTEYDQKWLVMPSIGLSPDEVVFEADIISQTAYKGFENVEGYSWTKVDALIFTNSPEHIMKGAQRGYLQYGIPLPPPLGEDDYRPITLAGRIYVGKANKTNVTIAFYILALDFDRVDLIDAEMIASVIVKEQ